MVRLFGTDGVRGLANKDITAEMAVELAVAAAHVLAERGDFSGHRPRAVLGRDTRISGQFLSSAVAAGLASAGVDVLDAGVVPTPAVARLTEATEADLGVVISASHNPMPDNGVKFFSRGGLKLPDAIEAAIEEHMGQEWDRPIGAAVGAIIPSPELAEIYVEHLVDALADFAGRDLPLAGLRVVVDAAHGAASTVGPQALEAAGATVVALHCEPDGTNINDGVGSTHVDALGALVTQHGADMGVAFDGDADRCLAVDATGAIVNGDKILGLLALDMKKSGSLYRDTLVATVMSNIGLHRAMRAAGIDIVEAAVGDRYVLEAMRDGGFSLGGEQSGHVIASRYASTGDGVLTAMMIGSLVTKDGALHALAAQIDTFPQVLVNVPNADRTRVHTDIDLQEAVDAVRAELGDGGRVLLRPSGTEPLVRVMVEAPTQELAEQHAHALANVVATRLGI